VRRIGSLSPRDARSLKKALAALLAS
jgi:hypothetical protein